MPQLSDVEAMQQLVRQLHAIVYGYQLAIGRLADGSAPAVAVARLREQRILLDCAHLVAGLRRAARCPSPSRPTNRR